MLSKIDIEKEIGKEINVVPFTPDNIREASLNLTASEFAWTYDSNGSTNAVHGDKILLQPHKTTLVVTREVIGLGKKIGGTVHSKVSMAAIGIGHIGTTFGPCYCGHFIIPLHNITDQIIEISVDDTFATLIFHYLRNKRVENNETISGHSNLFAEWNIPLSNGMAEEINPVWAGKLDTIKKKLNCDIEYKNFIKNKKKSIQYWKNILINILILLLPIFIIVGLKFLKSKTGQSSDGTTRESENSLFQYFMMYIISLPALIYSMIKKK